MKVGLVALHFPRPEHWDEMIVRVHRAAEVMAVTPGCLAVDCWVSDDGQAVVTTGQRESDQALRPGFAAVRNNRWRGRSPPRRTLPPVSSNPASLPPPCSTSCASCKNALSR